MIISDYFYNKMYRMLDKSEPKPLQGEPLGKGCSLLTFVVLGDPQVSNYMFARENSFYAACKDIARCDGIDALVIAGDIVENGMKCEFRTVSRMLNELTEKVGRFFLIPGNHDVRFRPYKKQLARFRAFASSVKNAAVPEGPGYYHTFDYPCCKFIMMGTDRATMESAYISPAQLERLDKDISLAEAENKPAFVFNHQTLKLHNGLPYTWLGKGKWRGSIGRQSDDVKKIFEKHNNVIFVTGHLHWGINEFSYEDYGSYKSLSAPTVGAGNHGTFEYDTQGFVISVYEDKIVIRGRLFGERKFVDSSHPSGEIVITR